MKTLAILLVLVLLPFSLSVDAGVKFETYDVASDTDSLNLIAIEIWGEPPVAKITLHLIKCDTLAMTWFGAGCPENYYEKTYTITCDTIFRIQYENVRTPVYLDSLDLQKLLRMLEEVKHE